MAESDSSMTPEQKLLNIIEGKPGEGQASAQEKVKRVKGLALPAVDLQKYLSPAAVRARMAYWVEQAMLFAKGEGQPIDLISLNRFIQMALLGLVAYFGLGLAVEWKTAHQDYKNYFDFPKTGMASIPLGESRMHGSHLFEDVERRNVFRPTEVQQAAAASENQSTRDELVALTKTVRLTGISINAKEPSRTFCMIEDVQKNMTSFLREGDTVGPLTIYKISSDSVILKYKNEQIELK